MRAVAVAAAVVGVSAEEWKATPWGAPAVGGDPSSGWLTYAQYTAPSQSIITNVSMSWNVPGDKGNPTSSGSNAPGWWYGVQTASGNGALVQPIVACDYEGSKCEKGTYVLWGGVFDWTKPMSGMHNSKLVKCNAGDEVFSYTACDAADCTMFVRNERTQDTASLKYKLPTSRGTESVLYIVLEHAPRTCTAYPPNGVCTFKNIAVEVDGKKVTPTFTAVKGGAAKCDSMTTIVDPETVAITWNGGKAPGSRAAPAPVKVQDSCGNTCQNWENCAGPTCIVCTNGKCVKG